MKAVFFGEHGDTDLLQFGEFPDPEIGAEEVLVDVRAGGLNHLDVWTRHGMPSPEEVRLDRRRPRRRVRLRRL